MFHCNFILGVTFRVLSFIVRICVADVGLFGGVGGMLLEVGDSDIAAHRQLVGHSDRFCS